MADSAGCGKLGAGNLAAAGDLAAIGNRARRKKFYHAPRPFLLGTPLISCLPVLLKNVAIVPMPLNLRVVAHGIILPDAPSLRIGGWSALL